MQRLLRKKPSPRLISELLAAAQGTKAETALRALGAAAAGFFMAGARFFGVPLPLFAALTASLGFSLPALGAFLGGAAGSLFLCDASAAVVPLAAGFLILAAVWALRELPLGKMRLFLPCTAAASVLLCAALSAFEAGFSPPSLATAALQTAIAFAGTALFLRAKERFDGAGALFVLFSLCCGSAGYLVAGSVPVGGIFAAFCCATMSTAPRALSIAAVCGLGLDVAAGGTGATAVFCAATLAATAARTTKKSARCAVFLAAAGLLTAAMQGEGGAGLFFAVILGSGAALFAPPILQKSDDAPPELSLSGRLASTAQTLERIYERLDDSPPPPPERELSAVFDEAVSQVCRRCARYHACWDQEAAATYAAMCAASGAILRRGSALPEDFPADFYLGCRHGTEFLAAIDHALEEDTLRRRFRRHTREVRTVVSAQYRCLADLLANASRERPPRAKLRFTPELGLESRSRTGSAVSGDRGAAMTCGSTYYLLLCDGMGTGEAARAEGDEAVFILTELLSSGMDAENALEMLNGFYILRGDGGFSTVDLAEVDLVSGEGALYKWGAAPSYLKTADATQKLGTASPPPGLGVGGTHRPQRVRLSMGNGEMLILTSDGVGGEVAERLCRDAENITVRALASAVVALAGKEGEDDRTAAVLKLRPVSIQGQHTTFCAKNLSKY